MPDSPRKPPAPIDTSSTEKKYTESKQESAADQSENLKLPEPSILIPHQFSQNSRNKNSVPLKILAFINSELVNKEIDKAAVKSLNLSNLKDYLNFDILKVLLKNFPDLEGLDISDSKLNQDIIELLNSQKELKFLNLSNCHDVNQTLKFNSLAIANLTKLDISGQPIDNSIINDIINNDKLDHLVYSDKPNSLKIVNGKDDLSKLQETLLEKAESPKSPLQSPFDLNNSSNLQAQFNSLNRSASFNLAASSSIPKNAPASPSSNGSLKQKDDENEISQ